MAKVSEILALIDEFAPFDTQEPDDNSGLLVGDPNAEVDSVLVALDLTMGAIEEAIAMGAQLIVTHHPIMYRARRQLLTDDWEGRLIHALIKNNIAMIAAHTNLDAATGGVSEVLASEVFIKNLSPLRNGLVAIGDYNGTLRDLEYTVRERVNPHARVYGKDRVLHRVAACGGAGSDFWTFAKEAGADCYLLGEARQHDILAAVGMGMCIIDAGHYETENLSIKHLVHALQIRINKLQYNARVSKSNYYPF